MKKTSPLLKQLLAEMRKSCRRDWFRPVRTEVYRDEKCPYCDDERMIHAIAPNGQELIDRCRCAEHYLYVWDAEPCQVDAFSVIENGGQVEVLPSEVDNNAIVLTSWWADPDPAAKDASEGILWNALFSTYEKFKNYCEAIGVPCFREGMEKCR